MENIEQKHHPIDTPDTVISDFYGIPSAEVERRMENKMKHIIFDYKGKTYQSYKDWSFHRIESVLRRIGASYWEIGI